MKEDIIGGRIKVRKSKRRKRTISAKLINNEIIVYAPHNVADIELNRAIAKFVKSFEKRALKKEMSEARELDVIFSKLNNQFFDNRLKIESIEYSVNQNLIYGCCNYRMKRIKISHRIAKMPIWVKEYVLMHEMAHLLEPNHSKRFWDIVNQYKFSERARGFLIAKGMEESGI